MRRLSLLVPWLLALLVSAASATAQSLPRGVDLRVRVTAPNLLARPLVGRTAAAPRDSFAMTLGDGAAARIVLPAAAVTQVELSAGRERLKWAFLGSGVGTLLGGVAGGYLGGRNDNTGFGAAFGLLGGALAGAVGGAVTGALAAPERWDPWRARF